MLMFLRKSLLLVCNHIGMNCAVSLGRKHHFIYILFFLARVSLQLLTKTDSAVWVQVGSIDFSAEHVNMFCSQMSSSARNDWLVPGGLSLGLVAL